MQEIIEGEEWRDLPEELQLSRYQVSTFGLNRRCAPQSTYSDQSLALLPSPVE